MSPSLSTTYATPLALHIRPSRRLRRFILLIHLLAGLAIALLPLSLGWLVVGWLLSGLSLYAGLRRQGRDRHLLWREQDWLIDVGGTEQVAVLDRATLVSPWLTILSLRRVDRGGRCVLPILPDAIAAESFRRLRVRLRVSGRQSIRRAKLEP